MVSKIDTLRTYKDSGKVNMSILVSISATVCLLAFSSVYLKAGFDSPPPPSSYRWSFTLKSICKTFF